MRTEIPEITFNKDQVRSDLLDRFNDFAATIRSIEVRRVLGKEALEDLPRFERQMRQHLEEPFCLVIIGDFKRGKSTLINALLRQSAVTTDVRPETVTINSLQHGPEPSVRASLASGAQVNLRHEDLKREALDTILERLPSAVRNLSITLPSDFLRDLTLVDTPGLGDLFQQFDANVSNYLQSADAIIHVVSALSPLSQGEQEFLRTVVAPQHFPKIVFVVNMLDALPSENDCRKVLGLVQKKIEAVFPNCSVFGISALDEWCRSQNKPRPNSARADELAGRFQVFWNHLHSTVLFNRTLISSERAANAYERTLHDFARKVAMLREAVRVDRRRLADAIAAAESRTAECGRFFDERSRHLQSGIEKLAAQAQLWMEEFVSRLESESIVKLPQNSYEDVRKHFQFFLVDSLRAAFERCLDAHQEELLAMLEQARADLAANAASALTGGFTLQVSSGAMADLPWTGLDTMHVAANMLFGAGFLINIVLGHVHNVKEQSQTGKLAEIIRAEVPKLRQEVAIQVKSIYSEIAAGMIRKLREVYENDLRQSLECMKQAQALQASDETTKATAEQVMTVVEETLESNLQFLQGFRQNLLAGAAAMA